jgi:REP element-mobilizing transposase RayT
VYYRWHTSWNKPNSNLTLITARDLEAERPDIHILQIKASDRQIAVLASLRPTHSVAVAASKLKGATSKLLRQMASARPREKLLGQGYFALTVGSFEELNRYLDQQPHHHGYDRRANPPVYVRTWTDPGEFGDFQSVHSRTNLKWHLVLSTWNRKGTFTAEAARSIVEYWASSRLPQKSCLLKAAFVPDHAHLAIRTHPAIVPADLVPWLLNPSQDLMYRRFDRLVISTGNPRLWKPGAYIGTVGKFATAQVKAYLDNA